MPTDPILDAGDSGALIAAPGAGEPKGGFVTVRVPLLILVNLLAAVLSAASTLLAERYYFRPVDRANAGQAEAVRVVADQLQRNIGERLAVVEQKVDDLRDDVRELRRRGNQ